MKKRYMILTVLIAFMLALPMLLVAGWDHKVITVAEARELNDDAKVALEGFITDDFGNEMYLFKDSTGEINLEIDDDVWDNRMLDPDQLVRIYGEIDRDDDDYIKVEVEKIKDVKIDKEEIEEEFDEEIIE